MDQVFRPFEPETRVRIPAGAPFFRLILRLFWQRRLNLSSYERCKDKDYQDVVTNAFAVLEDRIRAKIGIDPSYSGKKLVDYAFAAKTGKFTLGETGSEQESLYFLFRGAFGFFRNPPYRI
jgi:hypothetical protein